MWIRTEKGNIYKVAEQNELRCLALLPNGKKLHVWEKIKKQGETLIDVLDDRDWLIDKNNPYLSMTYFRFKIAWGGKINWNEYTILPHEQYMPLAQEIKG